MTLSKRALKRRKNLQDFEKVRYHQWGGDTSTTTNHIPKGWGYRQEKMIYVGQEEKVFRAYNIPGTFEAGKKKEEDQNSTFNRGRTN